MKRGRQIWFVGWGFLFLHITVSSLLGPLTGLGSGKWGDSLHWVWLWFVANTLGIFIALNFTNARLSKQGPIIFTVLLSHLLLLYVSYFTAAFREIQLDNPYEPIRQLHISYSWLLPLQALFLFLFMKNRQPALDLTMPPVEKPGQERQMPPVEVSEALQAQKIKWRKYIENAEPEKTFEQVEAYLRAKGAAVPRDVSNQFSNLKSRQSKLKREVGLGHLDDEKAFREASRINFALLQFIDDLHV